ncbi:HEAT repeat domain-containing protein [Lentisphaerota bacterium WC36G]|nr:HEAT repeat domain-containing protein [Lentisphaerae bacterium WC36]UDQ97764.1 HEAT repeat domain-containing protein [Lentisphaerae bacterium WC36]UDQ98817.1 HEAT repeat domain-containing protein [Lentisphaerae bacterium WC36]
MKNNKLLIIKLFGVILVAVMIIAIAQFYSNKKPVKTTGNSRPLATKKEAKKSRIASQNNSQNNNFKKAKSTSNFIKKNFDYGELNGLFKPEGKTKYQKYRHQLEIVKNLKTPLIMANIQGLHDYVYGGSNDRLGLHLKDEIFIKLESDRKANKSHIDFLSQLSADKSVDGDLRGYAVQHLRSEYSKADAQLRKQIQETLFDSLKDTQCDVSGTAILALSDLSKMYPKEIDKERINTELVSLVEDESMHIPSRIAMVQSVGSMKNDSESVTNAIRDLAFNDPGDMVLRLTAIATIGEIGTKDDIQGLENILKNDHQLYKVATQNAIQKLKNKQK